MKVNLLISLVRNLVKLERNIPHMTKNSMLFIRLFIIRVNISCLNHLYFFDHEALQFINHQCKLNRRDDTWVELLQAYNFTIKHKVGVQNVVANTLSRKYSALSSFRVKVMGFDVLNEMYKGDTKFREFWKACVEKPLKDFMIVDYFLFKGNAHLVL